MTSLGSANAKHIRLITMHVTHFYGISFSALILEAWVPGGKGTLAQPTRIKV